MIAKPRIVTENFAPEDIQSAPDERMLLDIGDLWRSIKAQAWVLAVSVALCMAGGFYIIVTTNPTYWASSEVILDPSDIRLSAGDGMIAPQEVNEVIIANEIEVLGSNLLVDSLVTEMSLDAVDEFSQPAVPSLFRRVARSLVGVFAGEPSSSGSSSLSREQIVDRVQNILVISPIGISHGIRIGVISTDAERAAAIANTLPAMYIAQRYDQSLTEITRAAELLDERTATSRGEMASLEAEIVTRRSEILELEQSNLLLTEQVLSDTSSELNALRRERIALEARVISLGALIDAEGLERAAHVVTSEEVSRVREELTSARILRDERAASLGPENVESKAAETQLLAMTGLLSRSVEGYLQSLVDELGLVASHEAALADLMRDTTDASIALEKQSIELGQLELEAAAVRRVYENLLQRLHETRAAQAFGSAGARIIEKADIPSIPARPKKTMTMAGSMVFGVFLGLSIIIAQQLFTPRVRSLREVGHLSGLPVIAAFPALSLAQRFWRASKSSVDAVALGGRVEQMREEVRKLRNAIGVDLSEGSSTCSCLLTSTVHNAEQTEIGLELAQSFARNGAKVLMVDCNFRSSALTHRFGLGESQGFSDALLKKPSADSLIFSHQEGAFDVMAVGTATPEAIEKISELAIKALLGVLKSRYDIVLFDASTWGDAAENSLLARATDSTVLVVDVAATQRDVIHFVARSLERLGVKTIGVVAIKAAFDVSGLVREGVA